MTNGFRLGSLIERVRTGSVLAPLLAADLICGAGASIVTTLLPWIKELLWVVFGLWALFGICVVITIAAYVAWAFRDPDRLQTEDYRLARYRLDLIGDERDPNNAVVIEATPTANTFIESAR